MRTTESGDGSTKNGRTRRRLDRRGWVIVAMTVLGGLLFYGAFYALVSPDMYRSTDPTKPFGYVFVPDDDEYVRRPHLVTASVWSHKEAAQVTVTLAYREGTTGAFREVAMQRVGSGNSYVVELPALDKGHRYFYYLSARDNQGARTNVPETAPNKPLPHVRWEDRVDLGILALHVTLMIGALFFLIHTVHYALLVLLGGTDGASRSGLVAKIHRGIRWGLLCFFVGGVPLGIYVSGTALGWPNAWGAWPLGVDITDTKTELLVLYWGVALALRADLWAGAVGRRVRAFTSDRGLAILVLAGAALTTAVYAIPHSYFFQ